MVTRRSSPARGTSSSASSPSTKPAVSTRKCNPTTGAPALTARVRSTTDGVSVWVSVTACTGTSRNTGLESLLDRFLRQVAPNEDDAAGARLVVFPGALMIAIEDHVDALEHETLGIVLESENTLAAQDAWPLGLHQVLHPRKKLVGIERLLRGERDRLHVLVVVVLETAVLMRAMVIVRAVVIVIVSMVVLMMTVAGLEKFRLDVEDTIEI